MMVSISKCTCTICMAEWGEWHYMRTFEQDHKSTELMLKLCKHVDFHVFSWILALHDQFCFANIVIWLINCFITLYIFKENLVYVTMVYLTWLVNLCSCILLSHVYIERRDLKSCELQVSYYGSPQLCSFWYMHGVLQSLTCSFICLLRTLRKCV